LNGVFATGGMTAALFYIYKTIEQLEVGFYSAGAAKTRDLAFLIKGLDT